MARMILPTWKVKLKRWRRLKRLQFVNWLFEKWGKRFFRLQIGPSEWEQAILIEQRILLHSHASLKGAIADAKRQILRSFIRAFEENHLITFDIRDRIDLVGQPKQVYGRIRVMKCE